MTRNRIESNKTIFKLIDVFCQERGLTLETHGQNRFITTASKDRFYLDHAKISNIWKVGSNRQIFIVEFSDKRFIGAIGFSFDDNESGLVYYPLNAGLTTAIISELRLIPKADKYYVKNTIDVGDMRDPLYSGHNYTQMLDLYPHIRLYEIDIDHEDYWCNYLNICIFEALHIDRSISDKLAEELFAFVELNLKFLPYRNICRSILDVDPRSLFLALYRCLEALYAYSSAKELGRQLDIQFEWSEIATVVEQVTGWYPKEESSLERLLRMASPKNIECLVVLCGASIEGQRTLTEKAAKNIYSIRNNSVHYRPIHRGKEYHDLDFDMINSTLLGIIWDIYLEAQKVDNTN